MQLMQPAHFEGSTVIERLSMVTFVSMYADYSKRPAGLTSVSPPAPALSA
jgi:hypothetical protein